jgi:hypothetical protein
VTHPCTGHSCDDCWICQLGVCCLEPGAATLARAALSERNRFAVPLNEIHDDAQNVRRQFSAVGLDARSLASADARSEMCDSQFIETTSRRAIAHDATALHAGTGDWLHKGRRENALVLIHAVAPLLRVAESQPPKEDR